MKLNCLLFLMMALVFTSCEKGEGQGGTNTITGTVVTEEWNGDFSIKRSEYLSQEEDVYIIYGDNDYFGERIKTNYNGVYEFKYLREGTYTIYVYSKNPDFNYSITNEKMIISKQVTISGKNKTVKVPEIRIIK